MEVVIKTIGAVLELNDLKSGQIDTIYFAGSPGKDVEGRLLYPKYRYGGAIADIFGITHLDPEKDIL